VIEFVVSREIDDPEKVWKVASDVYSIPEFWKGVSKLEVRRVGDHYEGKVRFAFPSTSEVRITVNDSNKVLRIEFLRGIIVGFNEVRVTEREIISHWKVKTSSLIRFLDKRNYQHFKLGAEHALERIAKRAKES
jgi:hypothetical protein